MRPALLLAACLALAGCVPVSPAPRAVSAEAAPAVSSSGACDFRADASVCRFVGPDTPFSDEKYVPADLVSLSGAHLSVSKPAQLRAPALAALRELSDAFFLEFGRPVSVVSGYRSYAYQKGIKDRGCPDSLCAKPGRSEHQTGLAVDLFDASTEAEFLADASRAKYFAWLGANAHRYGFVNSYRNGRETDGYEKEPWHWRYAGAGLAAELRAAGLSLGQRAALPAR